MYKEDNKYDMLNDFGLSTILKPGDRNPNRQGLERTGDAALHGHGIIEPPSSLPYARALVATSEKYKRYRLLHKLLIPTIVKFANTTDLCSVVIYENVKPMEREVTRVVRRT